jgi:hypothetical protein
MFCSCNIIIIFNTIVMNKNKNKFLFSPNPNSPKTLEDLNLINKHTSEVYTLKTEIRSKNNLIGFLLGVNIVTLLALFASILF